MTLFRVLAASLSVLLPACLQAQVPSAKVDFATDVQPILRQHCVECHGPDKQRGGMRLDRKSSAMKAFARRVVPGSTENSMLYHRIIGEFGQPMPPDGSLKPQQIATLKTWIEQGAEWPDALANEVDLPQPDAKAVAMVSMLRTGDRASFLKSTDADPKLLDARGPEGSTPFMYAVLYSDTATLRLLLDRGADVNKHNDSNATALMWGARDLEKTRLLLVHGADVNAKSDELRTALMVAARRPGNSATVKLLLDHGANPNPNAKPELESSPLMEALTAGDAESVAALLHHGADAAAAGETGMYLSISSHCPGCLDLLASSIKKKDVFTAALQDIAVFSDMHAMQLMLDHGADVNAYDVLGRTALMYAAMSDNLALAPVQLLIDHGADVNAKSKHANGGDEGLTALDMAKKNGETPVVELLARAGAKGSGLTPVALTPRLKNQLRLAVQDSLPLLQRADFNFSNKSGCVSCHNNSLTAMTVGLARARGFQIDEQTASAQVKVNAEGLAKLRDRLHQGFLLAVGDNFSEGIVAYILLGLHAEGYTPDLSTDAAAMEIMLRQQPDGQWFYQTADTRPPLCLDHIGETALSMRALQLYGLRTDEAAYRAAVQKAGAWMAQASSRSNDDRSWRVAGLAWAGGHPEALRSAMQELLAKQKADGSWSDMATMQSTAYATGKSLVALAIAGMPATTPAYKRGVSWLLSHQEQDGSWYVQTRAMAFQPYFDAGFPHGHDQWMSSAGSNWAAMALAYAVPVKKIHPSEMAARTAAPNAKPQKAGF